MDKIAVLDFGGQYTHLIAETLRDLGYHAEVRHHDTPWIRLLDSAQGIEYRGAILSGSPHSVHEVRRPLCDDDFFQGGIPILGICYGAQLISFHRNGGCVRPNDRREYGETEIEIVDSPLFEGLDKIQKVWMSHSDTITNPEEYLQVIGRTNNDVIAAFQLPKEPVYGVQFHPEVSHTPNGRIILDNFADKICKSRKDWTDENDIEDAVKYIREQVGDKNIGALTSFGVDSSVASKLTSMASDNYAIFYVSGLDRKGDAEKAERLAKEMGLSNFQIIDAEDRFLEALSGVTDPEKQRNVIGNHYIVEFDRAVEKLGWDVDDTYLVQGTLYTDRIESGEGIGKKAAKIKQHHNVGVKKIVEKQDKGLVVEPNKWKYKDGVRKRAVALGLPSEIVSAQPFPGPGLAVRMINEVDHPEDVQRIYEHINNISKNYGLDSVVFPIKTVGVVGDHRAYLNLAVTTGNPLYSSRRRAALDIVNNTPEIGRVAYSFSDLIQDELIDLEPLEFNKTNLALLRDIDDFVNSQISEYGLMDQIDQMPIILFPGPGQPWVGIRPISTDKYMTAAPFEIPLDYAQQLADDLIAKGDVGGLVFDDTDKPPGTIEWK